MCVCVYVCVIMCVCVYDYVCMCVYVCMYVCIYIHWKYLKVLYIIIYRVCFFSFTWHGTILDKWDPPQESPWCEVFNHLIFLNTSSIEGADTIISKQDHHISSSFKGFILQSQFRNHSQRILEMSSVSVTKISRARNARWRTPSYCMSVRECSRTRFRLGRSSWLGITSEAAGVTLKAGWQKRADSFLFLCLDSSLFFSLGQFSLLFAAFWS